MTRNIRSTKVLADPPEVGGRMADTSPDITSSPADATEAGSDIPPLTLKQVVEHLQKQHPETTYEGVRKWMVRRLYVLFSRCGDRLMVPISETAAGPVYGYTPDGLTAIVRYRTDVADTKEREANQLAWNAYQERILKDFGESPDTDRTPTGHRPDTSKHQAESEDEVLVAEFVGDREVSVGAIALTDPFDRAEKLIAERRKVLLEQKNARDAAIAQAAASQQDRRARLAQQADDLELLEEMAAIDDRLVRRAVTLRQYEEQRRAELGLSGGFSLD